MSAMIFGQRTSGNWFSAVPRKMRSARWSGASQSIRLAISRRIVLQVLPYTARDHAGAEGPITVYEFAEAPSVAYTECYGGGRIVEQREEVADLVMVMNLIRSSALSPADSLALVQEIRREYDQ